MIDYLRPGQAGRCSWCPAVLAGYLLVSLLAPLLVSLFSGCAQIIGIEDLPEIHAGQGGNGDVPGRKLVPSHGASEEHLDGVTGALRVPEQSTAMVNTDTGEILFWDADVQGVPIRGSGKGVIDGIGFFVVEDDVAVVAVDTLSVALDGLLSATGTRSLVLLRREDVSIRGSVSVSAPGYYERPWEPGPGGGAGAMDENGAAGGCAPGENGSGIGGGGGGGFRHHGATGGNGQDGFGGAGGSPADCSQDLMVLAGGSGGGAGGPDTGGAGGGGGGAVQITSLTSIEIIGEPSLGKASPIAGIAAVGGYTPITGVFASGSGGGGGGGDGTNGGGGGGGSGGTILLEAPRLVVRDAYVTANGGGGGGSSAASSVSYAGDNGNPEGGNAFGGGGDSPGGDGGTGSIEPTAGKDGIDSGGGGGGSAGIIHLHVPPDQLVIEGSVFSPEPSSHEPSWE
jgi:hypothetical protein